jgi:hypothetical protein
MVDNVERNADRSRNHFVNVFTATILLRHVTVHVATDCWLNEHFVELTETAVGHERGSHADGLGMAVEEIKEGMLAHFLQISVKVKEFVHFLLGYVP